MGIWEKLRGSRQGGGDIWDPVPRRGRTPARRDRGGDNIWDPVPQSGEAARQTQEAPDSWWERERAVEQRQEKQEEERPAREGEAQARGEEPAQAPEGEAGQTPDREERRRELEKGIRQVVDLAIQDYAGVQVGRYTNYILLRMEEWEKLCPHPGQQGLVAELRILAGIFCRRERGVSREKGRQLAQFLDERYGNEPARPPEVLPGPDQAEELLRDAPRNGWAWAVLFTRGENWTAPPYCPCCGRALTREELTPDAPPLSARQQLLGRIPLCRECRAHEADWPRQERQNLAGVILAGAAAGALCLIGGNLLAGAGLWKAGFLLALAGALLPGLGCPLGYRQLSAWRDKNPPFGHAARRGAVTVGALSPERIGLKITFARRGYARLFALWNGTHQPAGVDPPQPDREQNNKIALWAGLGIALVYLILVGRM